MHRNDLPGPRNVGRPLKCNMAKPPKGVKLGGSNRASKCSQQQLSATLTGYCALCVLALEGIRCNAAVARARELSKLTFILVCTVWTDEAWLAEHGTESIESQVRKVGAVPTGPDGQ